MVCGFESLHSHQIQRLTKKRKKLMADRFDLEEKIMRASWVLEDIRLLRDRYNQRDFTWDELDNFLMAMETIYQHRFDDLDDMMCQVFELNQYASAPDR